MDAALWQQIADWAAAHELWIAGGAAVALLSGALAARRRSRSERAEVAPREVAPAPVEVAPQPAPAALAAPAEAVPAARLRDRLRRTSDALVGGLGKLLGASVDDALLEQL